MPAGPDLVHCFFAASFVFCAHRRGKPLCRVRPFRRFRSSTSLVVPGSREARGTRRLLRNEEHEPVDGVHWLVPSAHFLMFLFYFFYGKPNKREASFNKMWQSPLDSTCPGQPSSAWFLLHVSTLTRFLVKMRSRLCRALQYAFSTSQSARQLSKSILM